MKKLLFFLLLFPAITWGQQVIDLDKTYIDSSWQSIVVDTLYFDNDSVYITNGGDTMKFVVDDTEGFRIVNVGADVQTIFDPGGTLGTVTNPTIAFGDGDAGIYETSDDKLRFTSSNADGFEFFRNAASPVRISFGNTSGVGIQFGMPASATYLQSNVKIFANNPTTTAPSLGIDMDNIDVGIGGSATQDTLSLIAGGVEGIRIAEGAGVITTTMTNNVDVTGLLTVTGTITGNTMVCLHTVASYIFSDLDSCRNVAHFNNQASVIDFTLPGAAAGLVMMFYDIGGGVITIDPVDGTDTIYLNGTSVGAGDAIDSPGAVGDFICLMGIDATRWVTIGRSGVWVDGGAD